jgi:hypothetical protein
VNDDSANPMRRATRLTPQACLRSALTSQSAFPFDRTPQLGLGRLKGDVRVAFTAGENLTEFLDHDERD